MALISKGAEAEIHLDNDIIIKKRIPKNYRLKDIDDKLRKFRTRREAKVLEKLPTEVLGPKLINMDDKNMEIKMDYIKGQKVRDILNDNINICKEIGQKLALMHNAKIIHGDLTTSNMIYNNHVHFIDFGLSYFSPKYEDKAVDLHLLKQALESKHYKVYDKTFDLVLKNYKKYAIDSDLILKRLETVESRGRNKGKN